jgi:folate-dependent phosphoribosylglycinamide formyltransferase PurN
MGKARVILLAGEGESTKLIFNGIKDDFLVEKVIIEKSESKIKILKRRVKTLGLFKVAGQVLFIIYNLLWLKVFSKKRIKEIKQDRKLSDKTIDSSLIFKVFTINSEEVINILKKSNPDVVVINGTRIISDKVLESIDAEFINTHVGITPKYRGVHGAYWALVKGDIENCGVTVHLVDSGIDTGDVLYQKVINIAINDNFNTYPYLQMSLAIPLMRKAIRDVVDQSCKPQSKNIPSRLWTHPTIWEYFKYRFLHGVK